MRYFWFLLNLLALLSSANNLTAARMLSRAVSVQVSLLPANVSYRTFRNSFETVLQQTGVATDEITLKRMFEEATRSPIQQAQVSYMVKSFFERPRPLAWKVYNDMRKRFGVSTMPFDEFGSWWDDLKSINTF